jgi:hypothetical protein
MCIIMHYLYDAHEMNANRADNVHPSVRMYQLKNRLTDFD